MKTLKTILQEVISGIKAWVDTNVVHKSGTETIDGTKTFSAPQCYSSNYILFNSSVLPTQNTAPSATINPLRQYIGYGTSYANSVFIHDTEMRANGRNHYRWTIYSSNHSDSMGMWLVYNPDSEYLKYLNLKGSCVPDANNTYHLGTPDYKWKSLNGVNPGALSLPDYDSNAKIDISGSITPTSSGNISYTPTINGWLYVCFNISNATTTGSFFYIQAKDASIANSSFVQTSWMLTSIGATGLAIFFPVVANKQYIMQINFTNYTITKAHVIPCLGNV